METLQTTQVLLAASWKINETGMVAKNGSRTQSQKMPRLPLIERNRPETPIVEEPGWLAVEILRTSKFPSCRPTTAQCKWKWAYNLLITPGAIIETRGPTKIFQPTRRPWFSESPVHAVLRPPRHIAPFPIVAFVCFTTGEKYTSCGCLQMGMIKAATLNYHNSERN